MGTFSDPKHTHPGILILESPTRNSLSLVSVPKLVLQPRGGLGGGGRGLLMELPGDE